MATASMLSMTVAETGVLVTVPDNDVARLMYYLNCVTVSLGLDILEDDLVDYKNYRWLSNARIELVFKSALFFSPNEFIDKLIFRDDDEIVTRTSTNEFCEVSVACDIVSIQRNVVIAGQVQNVTKVMFFRSVWLETYYTLPLLRTVLKSKHCVHCEGSDGMCKCEDCPRTSDSQCQPFLSFLIDSLSSTTISSSQPSSSQAVPARNPNSHQCVCDGCGKHEFQGIRYRCKICDDYDLCRSCYVDNVHNLSHRFMQIDRPGSSPIELAPRAVPPVRRPHTPAAPPREDPPPYNATSSDRASPSLYRNMTVSELKQYLRQYDVSYGDILDTETLSRRAWETHCDCMTLPELNRFLTENDISTSDCRDVTSRRQKAKDAFRAERPRLQEHDVVILTKLSRLELNGERAVVVDAHCGGGRAEVLIEESGTRIKVKFENLVVVQTMGRRYT